MHLLASKIHLSFLQNAQNTKSAIAHNFLLWIGITGIMASRQAFLCKCCKRSDFESNRGLIQHQKLNKFCSNMALNDVSTLEVEQTQLFRLHQSSINNSQSPIGNGS